MKRLSELEHTVTQIDECGAMIGISRQWYKEAKAKLAEYEVLNLTPDDLEYFVRCEDCIYGGWTDDVTAHCNKRVLRDSDHRCVGYLGFCGAGEKGEMLELKEAENEH